MELSSRNYLKMRGLRQNKDQIVELLRDYIVLGYSINKSCQYVGIPHTTVHTWIKNDKEVRMKINSWKNLVNLEARKRIVDRIANGDIKASMWWLDKFDYLYEEVDNKSNQLSIEINGRKVY